MPGPPSMSLGWPCCPTMLPKVPYTAPLGPAAVKSAHPLDWANKLPIYQPRPPGADASRGTSFRKRAPRPCLSREWSRVVLRYTNEEVPTRHAAWRTCLRDSAKIGRPKARSPLASVSSHSDPRVCHWFSRRFRHFLFPRVWRWVSRRFRCVRPPRLALVSRWFRYFHVFRVRCWFSRWLRFAFVWRFVGGFVILLCVSR